MNDFLDCSRNDFLKLKRLADDARVQIASSELLFKAPAPQCNSIATIMKHVGGNLKSRWSDFLTTDGEKDSRDRDSEFRIDPEDNEARIIDCWEEGWKILLSSLSTLTAIDLEKIVTIRSEPHTVVRAICRSLSHVGYHTGQIVYLCRFYVEQDWSWLSIPPGQSSNYNLRMRTKAKV